MDNQEEKKQEKIEPLRTYKSDVEEALQRERASVTSIFLAEERRRQKNNSIGGRESSSIILFIKNRLVVAVSILLILLGSLIFLMFNLAKNWKAPVPQDKNLPTLIGVETQKEIETSGFNRNKLIETILQEKSGSTAPLTGITGLILIKTGGEEKKILGSKELLAFLGPTASDSLVRSLLPQYLLGLHGMAEFEPFIILKTSSYENAFAGMLKWEKTMVNDIGILFIRPQTIIKDTNTTASSTATTTPKLKNSVSTTSDKTLATTTANQTINIWKDAVIRNKDARVIRNTEDKIILLYSFIDQETFVITTNEATLKEITERLRTAKLVH